MSKFTDRMEAKAELIADAMEKARPGWKRAPGGRSNIKPWYSAKSVYQPGVERALIGIDPGGEPHQPDDTTGPQYQVLLNGNTFNAFFDESWPGYAAGGAPLQTAVKEVYRSLYPDSNTEAMIRATACFNACPVRTGLSNDIHLLGQVWPLSQEWMWEVLEHIRPKEVICIANGDPSPWKALNVDAIPPFKFAQKAHLKHGRAHLSDGTAMRVIGLPHLTAAKFNRSDLYATIHNNRPSLLGLS